MRNNEKKNSCACKDKHHEVCYDGVFTFADPNCSCCRNTMINVNNK